MGITTDRNDPGIQKLRGDGQQEAYLVLSDEERAKGVIVPFRRVTRHLACGTVTTIPVACAETYARNPYFYGGTFCCHCGKHFDLRDKTTGRHNFVWDEDGTPVGEGPHDP
jgi:hypothetical protein